MATLPSIDAAASRVTVSRSVVTSAGDVQTAPSTLLGQARAHMPTLTLEEYTLARVVASELGNGRLAEQTAIADADATRARRGGKTLFAHTTGAAGTYGKQGAKRPVSTRLDPTLAHCQIARAVLTGASKGFARGAIMYFDPLVQLNQHNGGAHSLHPLVVLDKWVYNRPALNPRFVAGRYTAELGAAQPAGRYDWVGVIDGVRPTRLMLFAPISGEPKNYNAARELIVRMLGGVALPPAVVVAALLFWGLR